MVAMKRLVSLFLTATFALVILAAAPAEAMKPVVVDSVVFDPSVSVKDRYLTRQCGTAVWVTTRGHYTEKIYFDRLGAITRIVGHPSLRQTIFSELGGFSTPDVGVDKTSFNDEEGTVTVFGTGIHLKVKGGATDVGLWRLVFDARSGNLLSSDYHGNFDVLAPDILAYVCDQVT
jgi:hypothetical protein